MRSVRLAEVVEDRHVNLLDNPQVTGIAPYRFSCNAKIPRAAQLVQLGIFPQLNIQAVQEVVVGICATAQIIIYAVKLPAFVTRFPFTGLGSIVVGPTALAASPTCATLFIREGVAPG